MESISPLEAAGMRSSIPHRDGTVTSATFRTPSQEYTVISSAEEHDHYEDALVSSRISRRNSDHSENTRQVASKDVSLDMAVYSNVEERHETQQYEMVISTTHSMLASNSVQGVLGDKLREEGGNDWQQ